jgi:hypothetical protein
VLMMTSWQVGSTTLGRGSSGATCLGQCGARGRTILGKGLAYAPVLLGSGECLLGDMDLAALGYQVNEYVTTAASMHVMIGRKKP